MGGLLARHAGSLVAGEPLIDAEVPTRLGDRTQMENAVTDRAPVSHARWVMAIFIALPTLILITLTAPVAVAGGRRGAEAVAGLAPLRQRRRARHCLPRAPFAIHDRASKRRGTARGLALDPMMSPDAP